MSRRCDAPVGLRNSLISMIRAPIAFVLLLLCAHGASGGKVKKALFGAIFGEEEEKPHREKQPGEGLDPEQLELQEQREPQVLQMGPQR